MHFRTHVIVLVLLTSTLFGLNLGDPPLWDRDEPRNAGCAMEMLARQDWVVPVFNGELRTHKPVLLYWLMMSAYSILGVTEFSARVSSALLAAGTVFLTYRIANRLLERTAALWSAVVLASSLLFTMSARAATPDAPLIFFSTLAIWSFVQFALPVERRSESARWSLPATIAIYGAMGLAVLAKGPVGVVLPAAVLVLFLWTERGCQWSPSVIGKLWADMRPLAGLIVVLAIAGPWYLWVGIRTDGVWLREFFGEHNLGRALRTMEGHSGPAIIYYPLSVMVGFFPWSILLTPLLMDLIDQRRQEHRFSQSTRLAFAWIGIYLVAFSLARTKLPSYLLPAYPAIAICIGSYLDRRLRERTRTATGWFHAGFGVQLLAGCGIAALFGRAAYEFFPDSTWLMVLGAIPVVLALVGFWSTAQNRLGLQAGVLTCTAVLLNIGVFAVATTEIGSYQQCDQLFRALTKESSTGPLLAFGRCEPTWTYYARCPIRYFSKDECDELIAYVQTLSMATIVTTESDRPALAGLPTQPISRADIPYFLRKERLTALRYRADAVASASARSHR